MAKYIKKGSKHTGRPSLYTDQLADEICVQIATHVWSVNKMCEENPHFPDSRTIWHWLFTKQEFMRKYASAKESQAMLLADQILELTDNERNSEEVSLEDDLTNNPAGTKVTRKVKRFDNFNRTKLQVDNRKWLLSKLVPKTFGDSTKIVGDEEAPLSVVIKHIGRKPKEDQDRDQ